MRLGSLGHPVVGDSVYVARRFKTAANPAKSAAIQELARLFLHACSLSFNRPRAGQELRLESPLPPELEALLTLLR